VLLRGFMYWLKECQHYLSSLIMPVIELVMLRMCIFTTLKMKQSRL
jgi:hypothetical protein